jgi:hypothetical protein
MKYLTLTLLGLSLIFAGCKPKTKNDDTLFNLLLLNTLLAPSPITGTAVVTTFAGDIKSGYLDATGTNARFGTIEGITIDSTGNLYAGTPSGVRIRKITPAGVVTTPIFHAGSSFADGGVGSYRFSDGIRFLTVDSSDNLFVADYNNHAIRKTALGAISVSTFAGAAPPTATSGSTDGTGNASRFLIPGAIAIDKSNNLYVVDNNTEGSFTFYTGSLIRKITPEGVVSFVAGGNVRRQTNIDGVGSAANFGGNTIYGLTTDSAGSIYGTTTSAIFKIVP